MASAVAKILDDLRDRGGLKGTDVANMTSVSPATVSRWTSGKAFPQPKTQLLISDLRYVVDRLAEFYSPEETRIWLYARHPLLNGERAIDRIHDGVVLDALEALDPEPFRGAVWRVTRRGREPLRGAAAHGRWSASGEFEVLYTSLARDGALAEIGYRLSL